MGYQAQMMGTSDQYVAPGFVGVNPVPGLPIKRPLHPPQPNDVHQGFE